MANVQLTGLSKNYGDYQAVDNISLSIEEGEFFSLLGPSGCGKSTTLRMIAGFESCDAGMIEVGGLDVSNQPPEKRDIGFVFQNYAIFPHLNIFENIAFGLKLRKTPKAEIEKRVAESIAQVGLEGMENRFQREISGGQQQRVALARVLVTKPRVLLLDEPLSALDKNLREEMKFWIKDLQTSMGITTIYVTHDQSEALTMSDRIAVMQTGKVAQVGAPRDIYERPASRFVTKFIGETNLLEGNLGRPAKEEKVFHVGEHAITLQAKQENVPFENAVFAIRPEQIQIGSHADLANEFSLKVVRIIYQGSNLRYVFDFAGQELIAELANAQMQAHPEIGDMVKVGWPKQCGVLVDAAS